MNRFIPTMMAGMLLATGAAATAVDVEMPEGWHYEACQQPEGEIVLWVDCKLEGLSKTCKGTFYFRKGERPTQDGAIPYYGKMFSFGRSLSSSRGLDTNANGPRSFSISPMSPTNEGVEVVIDFDWSENGQEQKTKEKFLVPYQHPVEERRGRLLFKSHFEHIERNLK